MIDLNQLVKQADTYTKCTIHKGSFEESNSLMPYVTVNGNVMMAEISNELRDAPAPVLIDIIRCAIADVLGKRMPAYTDATRDYMESPRILRLMRKNIKTSDADPAILIDSLGVVLEILSETEFAKYSRNIAVGWRNPDTRAKYTTSTYTFAKVILFDISLFSNPSPILLDYLMFREVIGLILRQPGVDEIKESPRLISMFADYMDRLCIDAGMSLSL